MADQLKITPEEMAELEKLKLTYEEFNIIKDLKDFWTSHRDYKSIADMTDFEHTRSTFITWTLEYLTKHFPDTKFAILKYKRDVAYTAKQFGTTDDPMLEDTVAFKFKKNRPELYIVIQPKYPIYMDEYRYDAYKKGPFERPNWN